MTYVMWLCSGTMARASDSQLREPGFRSCVCFHLHDSSSLSCMYKHLAVDSGGYLCVNSLHAIVGIWLEVEMVFN